MNQADGQPFDGLHQAINTAKQERNMVKPRQYENELKRLAHVYACLYALELIQTPNIEIRRDLEKWEAVVFIKRKSIDVEMSRERVMEHKRETWKTVGVLADLVAQARGLDRHQYETNLKRLIKLAACLYAGKCLDAPSEIIQRDMVELGASSMMDEAEAWKLIETMIDGEQA